MSDPLLQDYTPKIMQSFGSACGVGAFLLVLDLYPEEERDPYKERLLTIWRNNWLQTFQQDLDRYNADLNQVTNGHRASQPEDLQIELNQCLAAAEKSARIALRMEVAS